MHTYIKQCLMLQIFGFNLLEDLYDLTLVASHFTIDMCKKYAVFKSKCIRLSATSRYGLTMLWLWDLGILKLLVLWNRNESVLF